MSAPAGVLASLSNATSPPTMSDWSGTTAPVLLMALALALAAEYGDADSEGNPLGLSFILNTGMASSGGLTFTLRHEPNKPNTGLENAGGETDIEVTFDVTVE